MASLHIIATCVEPVLLFRLIGFVLGCELAFYSPFFVYFFTATRNFALRARGL